MKTFDRNTRFETIYTEALLQPIPDMTGLRVRKQGYNDLPIDTAQPKFSEPVVNIADYGIAGQAYYSRPNETTGEPVPGVPKTLYLRKSLAELIARINNSLASDAITQFFGGAVEFYVQDALRSVSLQANLHDKLIPALIRSQNPLLTDEEVASRVRDIIALPSVDPMHPSPHATGAAVDIVLRYTQPNPLYVLGCDVPMGHLGGDTSRRIEPDYFEHHEPHSHDEHIAQRNRRAYYALLTGAAFSIKTGLVNNPTEWWHWGYGDQLAMKVSGKPAALYSLVEL